MKRISLMVVAIMLCVASQAQIFFGGGFGRSYYPRRPHGAQRDYQNLPEFKPSVNVSIGYGFPNLDMNAFPEYYRYYQGNPTYSGPINAAIDYQFSRNASLGLMVMTGHAQVRYYDYNTNATAMTGKLDSWSFLLNFVRYMPVSKVVTPYIRTAIGINSYTQNFTDTSGGKIPSPTEPSLLAYQIGVGAKFNLDKRVGLFIEGGYGKYILNGGLALKF